MNVRARMVLTVTVVTAIALGAAFIAVSWLFIHAKVSEADSLLKTAALRKASEASARGLSLKKESEGKEGTHLHALHPGPTVLYGVIYGSGGRVLEATEPFESRPPRIEEIAHPDGRVFDLFPEGRHFRGVLASAPGYPEAKLLIAESRAELDGEAHFLVTAMLTAFVLAVAWAAAVANWRVRELTREQRAVAESVRRFAQGELEARVSVLSSDPETAQLGSDFNEMASRIARLVAAQERFVAHAAHELRSPLAKLYGELQLALRKERSAAEYRRAIEEAHEATRRLKHLSDDLLTLARTHAAEEGGLAEAVEIDRLVADAVAQVENLDPARVEAHGASACIHGRASDLARLLRNLLENAVAHSPPDSAVRIDWRVDSDTVELRVSDDGEGVPASLREKIFEPFFRTTRGAGVGLGLGIAREIARAHGGDVTLDGAEQSATFVVTLPRDRR